MIRDLQHQEGVRFSDVSKLTERSQTTVPSSVRKAIGAEPGATLHWQIQGNQAIVEVQQAEHNDPAVAAFLSLLERDIESGALAVMPAELLAEARQLVMGLEVDLDEPLA